MHTHIYTGYFGFAFTRASARGDCKMRAHSHDARCVACTISISALLLPRV